ncbi:PAS domain S-box protein [Domibacillus tundrae]|uniref:PAS domain S-box protein n=1 Tax=Domibacillus tundrae TaxID=1587527 RepID=UPI0006986DC9|nr:PAS domain S-box protein [Domibacillus tundrae]
MKEWSNNNNNAKTHSVSTDEMASIVNLHTCIIKLLASGDSLHTAMRTLTVKLEEHFKRKTYCALMMTVEGNRLAVEHAPNLPSEYQQAIHLIKSGPKAGSCGTAVYRKETVISSNIENDPLWDDFRQDALRFGLRACWSIPILTSGRVVGTFAVYHTEICTPAAHEIEVLETCATLAGLAIERDLRIKLEQQLQESEQRFKSLFDYYPHSIYVFSLEGHFIGFNQATEPVSGYKKEELLGKSFLPLIAHEDRKKVLHHFNQAKKGIVQRYECKVKHRRGNNLIISLTNIPITVNDEIVGVYGIGREITHEKQVEQELHALHKETEHVFKNHQGFIFKYKKENDQFIHTFGDGQLVEKFGLKMEEITGKSLKGFLPAEIASRKEVYYEQAWNGNETRYEGDLNGVHYMAMMKPILMDGQVVEVIVTCNDITELKKAQQEILSLKQQMELVLDSIGDGIYAINVNQEITLINPAGAKMLGYDVRELSGKTQKDTFRPRSEPECCMPYQTLLDGKTRYVTDEFFLRKDGTCFPAEYTSSPIWENGEISGVVVAFRDISEKKMAEEYLLKSEKLEMAGQLAAGVAHEIRNPLTSIQGFIQLLEEEKLSEPEYFAIIRSEFERIEGIIGEFLTLAKPQAVNFQGNDVGHILKQTIHLMNAQATMHGIEVVSVIEPGLPLFQSDQHQLKQVFINVIKNAIEATASKGQLMITCKKTKSHLHIEFQDQGEGIPPERIKHLFEPFYSTKEKGTGLGLMVSYKIIEEHKGTMRIESEEGKGTTVHILLPISS